MIFIVKTELKDDREQLRTWAMKAVVIRSLYGDVLDGQKFSLPHLSPWSGTIWNNIDLQNAERVLNILSSNSV